MNSSVTHVAGFFAILLTAPSLMSTVIVLFRLKSDIEQPIAYPVEGLSLLLVCIAIECFPIIADSNLKSKQ
jgi:hypothetical protein